MVEPWPSTRHQRPSRPLRASVGRREVALGHARPWKTSQARAAGCSVRPPRSWTARGRRRRSARLALRSPAIAHVAAGAASRSASGRPRPARDDVAGRCVAWRLAVSVRDARCRPRARAAAAATAMTAARRRAPADAAVARRASRAHPREWRPRGPSRSSRVTRCGPLRHALQRICHRATLNAAPAAVLLAHHDVGGAGAQVVGDRPARVRLGGAREQGERRLRRQAAAGAAQRGHRRAVAVVGGAAPVRTKFVIAWKGARRAG